jgi:acylglycerol lipase
MPLNHKGGGIVLSFATMQTPPPSDSTVALLTGLIGSAPFIKQAHPAPKALRLTGLGLSKVVPWAPFPQEIPAEVSTQQLVL